MCPQGLDETPHRHAIHPLLIALADAVQPCPLGARGFIRWLEAIAQRPEPLGKIGKVAPPHPVPLIYMLELDPGDGRSNGMEAVLESEACGRPDLFRIIVLAILRPLKLMNALVVS